MTDTNPLQQTMHRYQTAMQRIEQTEHKLQKRTAQTRRRILNLTMNSRITRSTHARLFISHGHKPEITQAGAMAALMSNRNAQPIKPSPAIWTLQIEGKLLSDHLDFQAAADFDKSIEYEPPIDDLDRSSEPDDKSDSVKALRFTHFFEKVVVVFALVVEPISEEPSSPKKKKSRRSSSMSPAVKTIPEERKIVHRAELVWNMSDTDMADMWAFEYVQPKIDKATSKVHSVVAYIDLYRRQSYTVERNQYGQLLAKHPDDAQFRICSLRLQNALFPHHGPETSDMVTGRKRRYGKNVDEGSVVETSTGEVPAHNEVHIPKTLTITEIANAFFVYVRDRRLMAETEKTVVNADKLLQDILGMEQFSFSQLQSLLLQRGLIEFVTQEDPVRVKYILEESSASMFGKAHPVGDDALDLSLLQIDLSVRVPSLFPFRARELLRRIKRRELEYTSARTKARYNLLATFSSSLILPSEELNARRITTAQAAKEEDEHLVRKAIDRAAKQNECGVELNPVHWSLAKGAPPNTEARQNALLDARLCYLLSQVESRLPDAVKAHELLGACRDMVFEEEDNIHS